jgi:AAA15 family ATPase/GTPase
MTEQNKEYKEQAKGINHLKNEANEGKIFAQYQLYDAYYKGGYGIDKDEHIAEQYRQQLQLNMSEKTLYIKWLTLQNFRRFKEVTLDLNNKLILIVANNGAGKTSVLEAIANILAWFNNNVESSHSSAMRLQDDDIRNNSNDSSISGKFQLAKTGDFSQKKVDFTTTLEKGINGVVRKSKVEEIRKIGEMFRITQVSLPLIIFYSINRMSEKQKSRSRERKFSNRDNSVTIFNAFEKKKKEMLNGSPLLDSYESNYIFLDNLATGSPLYKIFIEKLNGNTPTKPKH